MYFKTPANIHLNSLMHSAEVQEKQIKIVYIYIHTEIFFKCAQNLQVLLHFSKSHSGNHFYSVPLLLLIFFTALPLVTSRVSVTVVCFFCYYYTIFYDLNFCMCSIFLICNIVIIIKKLCYLFSGYLCL